MSRFYDYDGWDPMTRQEAAHWAATVSGRKRALVSPYGTKTLRELVAALDALPKPILISGSLIEKWWDDDETKVESFEVCAVGAFAVYKGADLRTLPACDSDYEDMPEEATAEVGRKYGMRYSLARYIAWLNDEKFDGLTPAGRFQAMRLWATRQIDKNTEPETR